MEQFFQLNDLRVIIPELELAFFGMFLLIADLFIKEKNTISSFALIGVGGSGLSLFLLSARAPQEILDPYGGSITVDGPALFFKMIFLIAAGLGILISTRFLTLERENHGEFYALLLFATMGMMFIAGAKDLVTLYIGLETMAIATYILVGFLRSSEYSNEASLKYFLLGAFSSGILLYGFSLLYGLSGSTRFDVIASRLAALLQRNPYDPIVLAAVITVVAGMLFKIAAVPFHQWAPDAYQGAPTPVTAFMSVAVKAAAFAMMLRVLFFALGPAFPHWSKIIIVVSALTMTVGNIAAIQQTNIKRLLAYSSIAHAGYVLLGFIAGSELGVTGVIVYLLIYTFTNLGAWAVVVALRRKDIIGERIDEMNGLFFRHPAAAILMLVFLLSLAGIPPTAGFVAKYYLFSALIESHHNLLAVIAVLNAAISVFYYLRLVVAMFMRDATEKTGLLLSPGVIVTLTLAFLFTLGIGLYPQPILALAKSAISNIH